MKKQAMALRALLLEDRSVIDTNFYSVLKNIAPDSSVTVFRDVVQCISHLNAAGAPAHQLLFLDFCQNGGSCMEAIRSLRAGVRFSDLSIVVYDSDASMSIEETLIAGGTIYVQKKAGNAELGKVLQKVLWADYQYSSGKSNPQTYFLCV